MAANLPAGQTLETVKDKALPECVFGKGIWFEETTLISDSNVDAMS